MDMINDLNTLTTITLSQAVKDMVKYGKAKSQAEHDYRVAVQHETLKQREKGTPATLIEKIVNGITADLRLERDIQEVYYKTAQEKINAIKKQIEVMNEQIKREWSNNNE